MLALYGHEHGNRIARKHLGWVLARKSEQGLLSDEAAAAWRLRLLSENDNGRVRLALRDLFISMADSERQAA
jgi:hypothetical protein